ncbi:Leucine-rich repeat containing protein [Entamoeba marina]
MYFKLDNKSIFHVIHYITLEDVLPLICVCKRFHDAIQSTKATPCYGEKLTQQELKYFPHANIIKSRLEDYADLLGDNIMENQRLYEIVYMPNDVPFIPYLEQISRYVITLNVPLTIPNTVELLPIILSMDHLRVLRIDATNLYKMAMFLECSLRPILKLPYLRFLHVKSLSLTLSDHQKVLKLLFAKELPPQLKGIIEINRIADNNSLEEQVWKARKGFTFFIDCNENYNCLFDLLDQNKVYFSFKRVITGIGCTISEDTEEEEQQKYESILEKIYVNYLPRAICPNCVMPLKNVNDVENVTTLYSVHENLLQKMSFLHQLTISEQFGENKNSYELGELTTLTSLNLIAFESRKRVLHLPQHLKSLELYGFLNDDKDLYVDNVSGVSNLTSLTKLCISKCQAFILSLPTSIRSLDINDFPCLNEIPPLQNLQLLSSVTINSCPLLTSLSFSDSIRSLSLINCSQLQTVQLPHKGHKLYVEACYYLTN